MATCRENFGGDVKHSPLPLGIGLGEGPRRLDGEITVRIGHHGPDALSTWCSC